MAFVARFARREVGGYTAVFGKGKMKLTAVLEETADKKWGIVEGLGFEKLLSQKKLSVLKIEWGKLAEAIYKGQPVKPPTVPPVNPATHSGPPALNRNLRSALLNDDTFGEGWSERFPTPILAEEGAAKCVACGQPKLGWTQGKDGYLPPCRCETDYSDTYTPDPLDHRMYRRHSESSLFMQITPLGALACVYAWMRRNSDYVRTDGRLDEPWASVRVTLFDTTHYPEYREETPNESSSQ